MFFFTFALFAISIFSKKFSHKSPNDFLFTYLHPGEYYLTVIADKNDDGSPNQGDILSISKKVTILPLENKIENVTNIDVQN